MADELFRTYELIDRSARNAVGRGALRQEELPVEGGSRWGLGLVVLPPADVSRRLGALAHRLMHESANPHVAYEPDAIHVTVATLESFRRDIRTEVVDHYGDLVARCLRELRGGIELDFRGIGFAGPNIVARGYPGEGLSLLRSRVSELAAASEWAHVREGLAPRPSRNTAHATLVILKDGRHADDGLVRAVDKLQDGAGAALGSFTTRTVALVSYGVTDERIAVRLHRVIRW